MNTAVVVPVTSSSKKGLKMYSDMETTGKVSDVVY